MNDNDRELVLLQLVDLMSSRGEWCGASYLQAISYLLERSAENGCGFAHYWYRGGPYSTFVAETLEKLRAEGSMAYDPVVLPAGPSYRCTPAGRAAMENRRELAGSHTIETFLSHPDNQRLLLARAVFALAQHPDTALEWLVGTGAIDEQARESLRVAESLLPMAVGR